MENISKESILFNVEEKITNAKKEKINLINADKNHPNIQNMDEKINSLVLIKSELIRENKSNKEYHLTNAEEIILLNNMAEKRKQNIKDYANNGREELAEQEAKELSIINEFLPKMPSEDEIKDFIHDTIVKYLATCEEGHTLSMRDMGKVKALVNEKYPTVNGGIIKDVLMAKING